MSRPWLLLASYPTDYAAARGSRIRGAFATEEEARRHVPDWHGFYDVHVIHTDDIVNDYNNSGLGWRLTLSSERPLDAMQTEDHLTLASAIGVAAYESVIGEDEWFVFHLPTYVSGQPSPIYSPLEEHLDFAQRYEDECAVQRGTMTQSHFDTVWPFEGGL